MMDTLFAGADPRNLTEAPIVWTGDQRYAPRRKLFGVQLASARAVECEVGP